MNRTIASGYRFWDPVILVPRAAVIDALAARVPGRVLSLGTEVTSVEAGGGAAALVSSRHWPARKSMRFAASS
jgi:hypothetical protein